MDNNKWRVPELVDLCRYDREFRFIVDVYVLSNDFILGNEGERLRLALSMYGFKRLMSDMMDGLVDILPTSIEISAFNHPEITDEELEEIIAIEHEKISKQLKHNQVSTMKLTRYEQETIINFNTVEEMATVYTRDPAVMRKLDSLVIEFPEVYRCVGYADIDKTY